MYSRLQNGQLPSKQQTFHDAPSGAEKLIDKKIVEILAEYPRFINNKTTFNASRSTKLDHPFVPTVTAILYTITVNTTTWSMNDN